MSKTAFPRSNSDLELASIILIFDQLDVAHDVQLLSLGAHLRNCTRSSPTYACAPGSVS